METDSEVLLVLLAVRTVGGNAAPASADVFKGLKAPLKRAKDQGLLMEQSVTVPAVTKAGKPTKKKVSNLQLTDAGEQFLRRAASPEVWAAAAGGQVTALRQSLEADRQALRQEVVAALSAKGKGKEASPANALAAVVKTLGDLTSRVQKLEASLQSQGGDAVLARIDQGFQNMLARLDRAVGQAPTSAKVVAPQPKPAAEPPERVLREAYRKLRQFIEFEDGLVEIPRLYHEARRTLPTLSVEAFHRELESLWSRRELELKVLNEVRSAAEPDKGIRRNDNLYYFVYWANP